MLCDTLAKVTRVGAKVISKPMKDIEKQDFRRKKQMLTD